MNTTTDDPSNLAGRRYDLDWVRIFAFLLLIAYHVGMYYVTWDWHVKSPQASSALEPLMMLSSPWRLALLFLVSGVATAYLLARHPDGGFLGQRSVRLLVPLVFGMVVVVPPQSYLEVVEKLHYSGSYGEFWQLYVTGYHGFCRGADCLRIPTWNHLWFLPYLWAYTVVAYGILRAAPSILARARVVAERHLAGLGVLLVPAAYFIVARVALIGRFPPTHALVDDWYNHALYLPAFLIGLVLAGTRAPWQALERTRWQALALAVVGWAFLCAYFGLYADAGPAPPELLKLAQRAIYGGVQWLAIAAALGFARRHLAFDSAARRYLTTAIFPVYILHQTIIVVLAHTLQPAHLAAPAEALLLVLTTGALSFLGYEVIRRVRMLRPLFGLAAGYTAIAAPAPIAAPIPQDIH